MFFDVIINDQVHDQIDQSAFEQNTYALRATTIPKLKYHLALDLCQHC